MVTSFIALGSNLGERKQNINLALKFLSEDPLIKIIQSSSIIETEAEGNIVQPRFLNMVAKIKTDYSAQELLSKLQNIEVRLGRKNPHPQNSPRPIDLDILIFGQLQIKEDNLVIPHPRMWEREFVTRPLREIAPEFFQAEQK